MTPQALVVMGVAGSGKTTVGQALAGALGWSFHDGDAYHSPASVAKMSAGVPLDDEDRWPWLERLHDLIREHLDDGRSLVVGCSALKERYRARLRGDLAGVRFVYLEGDFDLILSRMETRQAHFMRPEMLRSQFDALEVPEDAIAVSVAEPIERIVERVVRAVTDS